MRGLLEIKPLNRLTKRRIFASNDAAKGNCVLRNYPAKECSIGSLRGACRLYSSMSCKTIESIKSYFIGGGKCWIEQGASSTEYTCIRVDSQHIRSHIKNKGFCYGGCTDRDVIDIVEPGYSVIREGIGSRKGETNPIYHEMNQTRRALGGLQTYLGSPL